MKRLDRTLWGRDERREVWRNLAGLALCLAALAWTTWEAFR